jgi:uncharacterized protein (TIGR03435 family)
MLLARAYNMKPDQISGTNLLDDEAEKEQAAREEGLAIMESLKTKKTAGGLRPNRTFGLKNATTVEFAQALSAYLDRPVKDATHLEGHYAFRLYWIAGGTPAPDNNNIGTAQDPSGLLSIFDAVQEQLGLKLEPKRDKTELLVIDSVSKAPTSN